MCFIKDLKTVQLKNSYEHHRKMRKIILFFSSPIEQQITLLTILFLQTIVYRHIKY